MNSEGLLLELIGKHFILRPSQDSSYGHLHTQTHTRQRHLDTHKHRHTQTWKGTETHTDTVLYSFMRRPVRSSHKRKQKRGSGKQSSLYSQDLGTLLWHTAQGHMGKTPGWSGGRNEGSAQSRAFIGVSLAKARQGRGNNLGLVSLNNFRGPLAIGVVPSCRSRLGSPVKLTRPRGEALVIPMLFINLNLLLIRWEGG